MQPEIAWIIPCYNEEQTIARVVASIRNECPGGLILVYDNNSTDRTFEIAEKAGATVRKEPRQGKGNVVRTAFMEVDADVVILIDGDLTYSVADWRQLTKPILDGKADMTVATRLENPTQASFRPFHVFGNHTISLMIRTLFRTDYRDVLSGYRAFSRRFVKTVGLNSIGFEIETELSIQALEHRFIVAEVALPYADRPSGSHSKLRSFEDGLIIILAILKLFKDHKPITCFGSLSLIALAAGIYKNAQGLPDFAMLFYLMATICLCNGLVLNSISQRSKELIQIFIKNSSLQPPNHAKKLDYARRDAERQSA